METVVQIASLAVMAAILSVVVREHQKPLALLLSLGGCVLILVCAMKFLQPVLQVVQQLRELTGLRDAVTAPLIKVTGIGLLTQAAGSVCADAGEKALEKAVEISGTLLGLYAALPLLSSVLALLEEMLGG